MTTIITTPPLTAYSYNPPASISGPTSVTSSPDPNLAQTAVTISSAGNIVATLMANPNSVTKYDAVSLLNALAQAGTPSPSQSSPLSTGSATTVQPQAQTTFGAFASTPGDIYTASGALQTAPATDVTSNWASILKTNPALTAVAVGDAMNQGIVGLLSPSA